VVATDAPLQVISDVYRPNMNRSHLSPRDATEILSDRQTKSGSDKEALNDPYEAIFFRLPKVKAVTGLSKSSLYELIRADRFPAPVHLGARTVAWVAAEVKQWAAERILSSRTPPPSVGARRMPQRAVPAQSTLKKWA
jgi:prophage regulatory protein